MVFEVLQAELDEMITLASSALKLYNDCNDEITRLQKLLDFDSCPRFVTFIFY